jgi:hypothetical protein
MCKQYVLRGIVAAISFYSSSAFCDPLLEGTYRAAGDQQLVINGGSIKGGSVVWTGTRSFNNCPGSFGERAKWTIPQNYNGAGRTYDEAQCTPSSIDCIGPGGATVTIICQIGNDPISFVQISKDAVKTTQASNVVTWKRVVTKKSNLSKADLERKQVDLLIGPVP